MMFLSALNVGALKVMLRRSSPPGWEERGAKLKIKGLAETRGRKQKSNSLVNDVRKSGDPTTIEGRANSHRKTNFLFLRKRIRRAMRDEKSRHFFGVASGEDDFRGYTEVLRALEWIDDLASH